MEIINLDEENEELLKNEIIMVAGRYIIDKKIGKGSFGEIYKGHHKETKEDVAIKIVFTSINISTQINNTFNRNYLKH